MSGDSFEDLASSLNEWQVSNNNTGFLVSGSTSVQLTQVPLGGAGSYMAFSLGGLALSALARRRKKGKKGVGDN